MTKLEVAFRNFAKAPKNTTFRICMNIYIYIKHTYIHKGASQQNIESLILHFTDI